MLSEQQLARLLEFVDSWVAELAIPREVANKAERIFTCEQLLPWLQGKVQELRKPELYVRGDGGPAVQSLYWQGFGFYPDLSLVMNLQKLVAFEVKFIRDGNSSNPLTKAIGQAFMYSNLGFVSSHALVFDIRRLEGNHKSLRYSETLVNTPATKVHIFR